MHSPPEMIAARRRFLETGVYQPIADAVAEATLADLAPGTTASCLDAGCGESAIVVGDDALEADAASA